MRIIAFAGLARSGKTTAARILDRWCRQHHMIPVQCSFAGPMKKAAERIGLSKDSNPAKYRRIMQSWGERKRDPAHQPGRSGPDYWVNKARKMIVKEAEKEREVYRNLAENGLENDFRETVLIFDDMRYINELNMVTALDGISVFVDGATRLKDLSASWRAHESEALATLVTAGVIESEIFDYFVPNETTENNLIKFVRKLAPAWFDHTYLCPCCGLNEEEEEEETDEQI